MFMLFVELELDIIRFMVTANDTINNVKTKIHDMRGIPTDKQRLSFKGKKLNKDDKNLSYYNIVEECTLILQQ